MNFLISNEFFIFFIKILNQILNALLFLENEGIAHRDN